MTKKKIMIKDKGIVIEVPYAEKYMFIFKTQAGINADSIQKFIQGFNEAKKMVVTTALIEQIICFKSKRKQK